MRERFESSEGQQEKEPKQKVFILWKVIDMGGTNISNIFSDRSKAEESMEKVREELIASKKELYPGRIKGRDEEELRRKFWIEERSLE